MTPQPSSKVGKTVPERDDQQLILQQAEAVIATQNESTRPTRYDAYIQQTDLIDESDDDIPPAYGKIYGEIHDEKTGLGANVTDDGRVNLRINQLNRRLSQIFTPALREQVQTVQETRSPPLPYIPSSLGGNKSNPSTPSLNVVIQVVGSRGDVQPFVALGKVLRETYGHRVRLATHPNFKDFVEENGLEFFSIGGDPSRLMAFMVKNPGLMPGFRSVLKGDIGQRRRDVAEYIQGCWRSCYKAGNGMEIPAPKGKQQESSKEPLELEDARPFVADCIIANPPSFAHIHCAEKLGIPLHIMFTMPYSSTNAFPHPLANIQSSNADPQLTNYISYAMIEVLVWQGLGEIINRFRVKCLGLDPVSLIWAPGMLQRLKVPHTYCWSPALIDKPKDWGAHISIVGFYLLSSPSNYTPSQELQDFLSAGPPPVYIGFGSIVLEDPNAMTKLIFGAARKTGQRVLLSKGWGGMGAEELHIPDGVFMLDNVPHDWLFKQVSCVVHHGGAGTTAAGITAGRPTVVVPFFGDQPFWGAMIARAGAGPQPIPYRQLTVDNLADAINFCLNCSTIERAKDLASKIGAERGSEMGARSFHQNLDIDRLRCTLSPSRTAVWRIKRTQIKLSAFVACTLANAKLLNFNDLKLFRPQEYNTDEGPWDPVSGFATTLFGAISSMAMGVADLPSETAKGLMKPFGSRTQPQTSESAMPTPPGSPRQNQVTLNTQGHLAHDQSLPSSSRVSTPTPSISSSSVDVAQDQPNFECGDSGRVRVRSRNQSSNYHDMLRQTSVHTSKGFGRIVKAAIQSPMELSVSITEGFHNTPKLWGDDTVRPQQQVTDMKSGFKAIGNEFACGWYDGITGLFTQPWKGAQTQGAGGFIKGVGKGIGGFLTKPGAALFGIPSYFMKGIHKELQGMFGSNVQNYIVASRAAQGYEEWLESSDVEKQDVIDRWKIIQKYLNKKDSTDEILQDILEAQQTTSSEDRHSPRTDSRTDDSAQTSSGADSLAGEIERLVLTSDASGSSPYHSYMNPGQFESTAVINELPVLGDAELDVYAEWAMQGNETEQQNLVTVMANSEAEAQQRARQKAGKMVETDTETAGRSPGVRQFPVHDPGHLAGPSQCEFEAQQRQQGEKTTQERTEEDIVMEYVKKQSLLEENFGKKSKGKEREIVTER